MRIYKGFTLAEVMITMAVLGVLASILLPAVSKVRPNENKTLFKKAYYVAERMTGELVNDETLYPVGDGEAEGLANIAEAWYDGECYGKPDDQAPACSNGSNGSDKYCKLFAAKVNTINEDVNCVAGSREPTNSNVPSFITTDGIYWYMPYTDFDTDKAIIVDVNGDKKPNCRCTTDSCADCTNPDQFQIWIEPNGRMYVDGIKEKEYLSSNKSMQ